MAELVYRTCLENKSLGNRTVGSNPTPSAGENRQAMLGDFVCEANGVGFEGRKKCAGGTFLRRGRERLAESYAITIMLSDS